MNFDPDVNQDAANDYQDDRHTEMDFNEMSDKEKDPTSIEFATP